MLLISTILLFTLSDAPDLPGHRGVALVFVAAPDAPPTKPAPSPKPKRPTPAPLGPR
jgi:hypothetical protein